MFQHIILFFTNMFWSPVIRHPDDGHISDQNAPVKNNFMCWNTFINVHLLLIT